MPKDITKEDAVIGTIMYQWTVPEYEQHERGRRWYIIMIVLGALTFVYALISSNYLFALIVALFGIILYLHEVQAPLQVPFAVTETGIVLGKKHYKYSELKDFWVIYNPPGVKSLYFTLNNVIKHRLTVPFLDYDPRPVRNYLNQYLQENLDEEEEPLSDRLGRLFKLH